MCATPDQIDRWRTTPSEHQRLEFKEAKNQYDYGKLCEYCISLANEGEVAQLLLGVADKPPRPGGRTHAVQQPRRHGGEAL